MKVEPYLFFDGRCEQALDFYKKTLGANVEALIRYQDNPDPQYNPPNSDDKVTHALFRVGDAKIMASDGDCASSASTRSPRAARCRCRSTRPSSPRASAWSPTASACRGW